MADEDNKVASQLPEPEHGIIRNRDDDGWYVMPVKSGVSPKPFLDALLGGDALQSYSAACEHNKSLRPFKASVNNYQNTRSDKARPDLPVGITLAVRTSLNKGGRGSQIIYSFKVSRFGQKPVTVHIGTVNTFERNFSGALEKAIALREKSRRAILK